MNTHVATIERTEKRPIPKTPCPLVHPEPIQVPIPTRNPAITSIGMPASILTGLMPGPNSLTTKGPAIRPTTKANRQPKLEESRLKRPTNITLIPATRPVVHSNNHLAAH